MQSFSAKYQLVPIQILRIILLWFQIHYLKESITCIYLDIHSHINTTENNVTFYFLIFQAPLVAVSRILAWFKKK